MVRWADIVHLNGVYSFPTIPTLAIARMLGKPVVWSPHGALQHWHGTTNQALKRLWDQLCNILIDKNRSVLHVTSPDEATASTARIRIKTALIPNGVDVPASLPSRRWRPEGMLRLLYIGRIHPIKGIENLLTALRLIGDRKISLSVCGTGDKSYIDKLKVLVRSLELDQIVTFNGHVDDREKIMAFMKSDICVVPSFTENFGMVVAEALAHGVPVIVSKGAPWEEVEKRGCGVWVDNSPAELARAIEQLSGTDLSSMGNRGRQWMTEAYSWDSIASRMCALYELYAEKH